MAERLPNGHFAKGNKLASNAKRTPPELKELRTTTKEEIKRCAASLAKTLDSLQDEMKRPGVTRLEYLTGMAITKRDYKFIQWLIEMAVGRPHQTMEVEETQKLGKELVINKINGDKEILKVE